MSLKPVCALWLLYCGGASGLATAIDLSHNEVVIVSNFVREATLQTVNRFETGDLPWGSASFDKLAAILTDQYVLEFTKLLDTCQTSDERRILICAFQKKDPSFYMGVLEQGLDAFTNGKLDMQNFADLLSPRGALAGIIEYNYQNPRMARLLNALKSKLETKIANSGDEKGMMSDLLEGVQSIQSGLAKTALMEDRKMYDNPGPIPILP